MDTPPRQKAPKTRVVDLGDLTREFPPGTLVDRYEIVTTLGSGGCGVVYAARHVHLNQTVALKLLHRNLITSEERVERFYREARASAAVENPHVVRVSDCGVTPEGVPFLAMEFLKGVVLENIIEGTDGMPLAQAVDIGLQLLDGLDAAHSSGVVHRDLKPENIFLVPDSKSGKDLVKILDFGVSKMVTGTSEKVLTSTGALLGTPRYMAPEQFRGARNVDHRADIFAAAVVLFQMLSGKLPFEGDNPLVLAHRAATQPPRPLHELTPGLPDDVCGVIYQGLEKDPEERWQNARAFAEALRTALANSAVSIEIDLSETEDSTDLLDIARATDPSDIDGSSGISDIDGFSDVSSISDDDDDARDTFQIKVDPAMLLDRSTIPSSAGIPAPSVSPTLKSPFDEDPDDPTLPTGTMNFGDKAAAREAAKNEVAIVENADEQPRTREGSPDPALDITPQTPPPAFAEPPPPKTVPPLTQGDESESTLPWEKHPQPSIDPYAETSQTDLSSDESLPPVEPTGIPSRPATGSIEPGPAMVRPVAPTPSAQIPGIEAPPQPASSEHSSVAAHPGAAQVSAGKAGSHSWRLLMVIFAVLSLVGGIALGYFILETGWFDATPTEATPSDPARPPGQAVEFSNIEITGPLDEAAINAALTSARSSMEMCRRPQSAQIALEVHVTPPSFADNRISMVRSLPADQEPDEVAQCCINAFRGGIPAGWNPGDNGIVTFEITLPQR